MRTERGMLEPRVALILLTLIAAGLAGAIVFSARKMGRVETEAAAPVSMGQAPVFLLTDQDGETFRSSELEGKVWMADFFFTRCRTICPVLTQKMLEVQEALAAETGYHLVSISVDPEHDTAEVLREFAREKGADPERWTFLTGDRDYIYDLVRKGFLSPVSEDGTEEMPIIHSPRIALVDREGYFRGFFNAMDDEQVAALIAEARALLAGDSPA